MTTPAPPTVWGQLAGRSGYELRVIAALSAAWPFQTDDATYSAAHALDTIKRKDPDLWESFVEVNLAPKASADIIVWIMLTPRPLTEES